MLSTCSPQRDSSVMVQIQCSPHAITYDPHSAIREIRRSLSRSPSKGADGRHLSFRSSPVRSSAPFQSSPLSPSRRVNNDTLHHFGSFSSPHQSRLGPSSRVQRPTLRRSVQGLSVMRARTSPKSPSKRALFENCDFTQSSPMLRKRSSDDAEIDSDTLSRFSEDKENANQSGEDTMTWKAAQIRQEKRKSGGMLVDVVPLSPMKRGSEPMNVDKPDYNSPSTKRRSLHASSGMDFSIFDSEAVQTGLERRAQDDSDCFRPNSPLATSRFSTIPKRSSSLRKSTLQQRQPERTNQTKHNQHIQDSLAIWIDGSPDAEGKKPTRLSLDNHLPSIPRDSPFSAQGSLLNASIHPVSSVHNSQTQSIRHPLSRTLTQSSSTPSTQDDSPTHEPIRRPDRPISHDFSKSLPVGAMRPTEDMTDDSEPSSQNSFATPANYKFAKPLPAAFMSTGLISKKNRNTEEPNAGLPKAHMPDTPCKRQSIFEPTGKFKAPNNRTLSRQSFGTPSASAETPFGMPRAAVFPKGKSTLLFGARSSKNGLTRKASFASIDSEEKFNTQSPTNRGDSQSTDSDFPLTPTKLANAEACKPDVEASPSQSNRHSTRMTDGMTQVSHFSSSKFFLVQALPNSGDCNSEVMDESPSAMLKPRSLLRIVADPSLSFTRSRRSRNLNSPTPLSRPALVSPKVISAQGTHTKVIAQPPVSPHLENIDRFSPHTPQEGCYPPDPSGLTISGHGERPLTRNGTNQLSYIPATPTGPREYFGHFSNRPSLNLNAPDVSDVDRSLTARFDKVDLVGTGEFSQVYRVTLPSQPCSSFSSFQTPCSSSRSSMPERVWAVKKSRYPYSGPRDRQRKIHEVDVLKTLGHAEHVVSFVESWEDNKHLYIQTEFCEEGTLDVFLSQAGLKARLDDFRIWKILLELSLGLQHIHNSGFIHLDLKPANIFITFDGTLKIGDFGMAAKWPAKAGIEGEGDREYIGPEILMGQYDKPADVFALGLIMLETAGNVELPDNGLSWQKLRQGDMSDVPSLTFSSSDSATFRDASGNPIIDHDGTDSSQEETFPEHITHLVRSGELLDPPEFMINPDSSQALDRIVRWMISPIPSDRPVVDQVLRTQGVIFAETRRRAGATIFEGNWGPADEIIAEDAEMMDV